MVDVKFSALWSIVSVVLGFAAFGINFWVLQGTFPGYKILLFPGIVIANIFSEEINFWPKLGIMLSGQYLVYFVLILVSRKLAKLFASIQCESTKQ